MEQKPLTVQSSTQDFKRAYRAKAKLIERQKDDFLFRLGKQWPDDKVQKLKEAGIKPVTDNRIQPNIFLLTGLERQNRSDFKAFPEGEEDTIKAEIASALFKDSIKKSDFGYKASEAFEDGVTCGESALELYLDNTHSLLNAKPQWKKIDSSSIFPEPGSREYDYSDARYLYKLTIDLSKDDLIALFPEKREILEKANLTKLDVSTLAGDEKHSQPKDYPKDQKSSSGNELVNQEEQHGDLLERYYKKWVQKHYVGDKQTGEIKEAETKEKAESFIQGYKDEIMRDQLKYEGALHEFMMGQQPTVVTPPAATVDMGDPAAAAISPDTIPAQETPAIPMIAPTPPEERDPERFILLTRHVPEIWYFAHTPGVEEPLADERAWFYPEWKSYPVVPYFAHLSTAPISGEDSHLLVQGIVYGVKGVQEKHNSMETLKIMYLNSSANGGWLTEEDAWVDRNKVQQFGASPGVNLEYKKGHTKPERIFPMPLSQGHSQIAEESAEAMKGILGMNADLLAMQDGGSDSGRAISLRMRQGLLMIQKLFDNLSRTKQTCGRLLLSQLGKIYDTETAKKVLGDAFLEKNFPPPMVLQEAADGAPAIDPATGQPQQIPMNDPETGQPMTYDKDLAELAIAEVLSGELGQYDVTVGESVASETMKVANALEVQKLAETYPQLIPPEVVIEESQIPQAAKNKIISSIKRAQALAAQTPPLTPPAKKETADAEV